jgi:hypothetical protein
MITKLTFPQRCALAAHLIAWASDRGQENYSPVILAAAQRMASRLVSDLFTEGPASDLEVLKAAVFLSPGRDLIGWRELASLKRAWDKMGWAHKWPPGLPEATTQALAAASKVRAILGPQEPTTGNPVQVFAPVRRVPIAPEPAQGLTPKEPDYNFGHVTRAPDAPPSDPVPAQYRVTSFRVVTEGWDEPNDPDD